MIFLNSTQRIIRTRDLVHAGRLYHARLVAEGDALATEYVTQHSTGRIQRPAPSITHPHCFGDADGDGAGNCLSISQLRPFGAGYSYGLGVGTGNGNGHNHGEGHSYGNGNGYGYGDDRDYPYSQDTMHAPPEPKDLESLPIQILACTGRWVWVGHAHTDLEHIHLYRAQNVRRWDTGAGLGPVALHGPNEGRATLDPSPPITIPRSTVLFSMQCSALWVDVLREREIQ